MQRLNRGMLSRYDIPDRAPATLNAVQFGLDEALLGVVDRLLDDAGNIGLACAPLDEAQADLAARLRAQDGLYTVVARGYRGEADVRREQVVQAILRLLGSEADLDALAREPALALGLVNLASDGRGVALGLAARLLESRWRAGLGGLTFICLVEAATDADDARGAIAAATGALGPDFAGWLRRENAFLPALADGFAGLAEPGDGARLCGEMNYSDEALFTAEPYARLVVQAGAAFRAQWPLDRAEGVAFVGDIAPDLEARRVLLDAGLFAMAAPGWLLGCDTLRDCMAHERLRAFVGGAYMEELLPRAALPREAAAAYVIQTFERFENPLNRNAILRVAAPLLRRFRLAALPLIRAWAAENFEPPRALSYALAATIMLYAGARPNADGVYEVARGSQAQVLRDDPAALAVFSTLAHDMPPEALAYAVLADRDLWGCDLREIDGLEARVALDIAAIQRDPGQCPEPTAAALNAGRSTPTAAAFL